MSSGGYQIIVGVPEGYRNPRRSNGPSWAIGEREDSPHRGGASGPRGAPGGVLLPPGGGLPPLALLEKEGGREKEERGAPPPFLVLFGLGGRGRAACPGRPSSSPLWPM